MRSEREAFALGANYLWWMLSKSFYFCGTDKREEIQAEALRRYPDIPLPTVRDVMLDYLKREGYDGLCNERCQCWCDIEAITLCKCIELECRPGVLVGGKIVERG